MLNLGENAPNKIKDIILETDRPKTPINQERTQTNQSSFWNEPSDISKSQSKSQSKSPFGKRLYDQAKQKQKKIYQQEKQKMYIQAAELRAFKVTNKHSIFLNSKKQKKPIYQRIHQIIYQRQKSVIEKRQETRKIQEQKQQQQQQQIRKWEQIQKSKKASAQQVKNIILGLDRKQKQRLQRINMRKIEQMRKTALQSSQKPKLTKNSKKIWQKKMMQRSLSTNVIQRFDQYGWQKKINEQRYRQQIRLRQTPFKPKITDNSRIIASRISRSPIGSDLNQSTSCKCFKKQQNVLKYLQPNKSQQYFMGSSNVKCSNHQKSASTHYENSSRYLGQSISRKNQNRNQINVKYNQSEYRKCDEEYDS